MDAIEGQAVPRPNPRASRKGHRATVTKLRAEIQAELDDGGDKLKLGVYLKKLAKKSAIISELDSEILGALVNEEDIVAETTDQDNKMLELEQAMAILELYVKGEPHDARDEHDGKRVQSFAKLPKLDIKPFSGDALEYPTFQQQFEASIGRGDLADVAKFSYLKGLLRGEALRSIQGLSLTQENYNSAWELLEKRFGRKNVIVSSLMKQMTSIKQCGESDTKSLRTLLDKVSSSIRALDALAVPLATYGALLAPIVRQKLPQKLNLMMSRQLAGSLKGDDFIDIDAIRTFLETELTARESVELTSGDSSMSHQGSSSGSGGSSGNGRGNQGHSKSKNKGKSGYKHGRATGAALVSSRAPSCGFCQGGHWADQCQKVKGLKQRKDYCVDNKLCYNCLKAGHFSNDCNNDRPCYYCHKKGHHQALCNEDDNEKGKANASKGGKVSKGGGGSSAGGDVNSVLHAMEYSNKVMLMTASTTVTNPTNGKSWKCRVILDSACDTSFIKEALAQKLGLTMEPLPMSNVGGFGGHTTKMRTNGVKFILGGGESQS